MTDEERRAMALHIDEGFLQAERDELINGDQVRRELEGMKNDWRASAAMSRYVLTPLTGADILLSGDGGA